jgi:hypothetical protein
MKAPKTSHQALVRYAMGLTGMVFFFVALAFLFSGEKVLALLKGNFNGLTYFNLLFFALLIVAWLNGIFYAFRLITWGKTVSEGPHTVLLPFISRLTLEVPPSVSLRVMMFIRDRSTLSDLTGSIKIYGNAENLLSKKGLSGKHGTNAKIALLRIKSRDNHGQIIVDLNIDWRRILRFPGRDPTKDPLVFDIIVKAKIPKT